MEKGNLKAFKREFQLSNCGFNHDPVDSMVRSQWQSHSQSNIYLIYRWIVAAIVVYTVFIPFYYRMEGCSFGLYFIYLTLWCMLLNMTVGIYGAILVALWHYNSDFKENISKSKEMPAKFKVYWALHNIALTLSIVISIVYWALIFDDQTPVDQVNIMSHVLNSVIMFVDICIVAYPLRLYHVIQPVCFGITYSIFSYIYYICGGVNIDQQPYIYKVLRWDETSKTLIIIGGTLILCIMVHIIIFLIHTLRISVHRCCCSSTKLPTTSISPKKDSIASTMSSVRISIISDEDGQDCSSAKASRNLELLTSTGITHILNIAGRQYFPGHFVYKREHFSDTDDFDEIDKLRDIFLWLDMVTSDPKSKVLIQCMGGMSRSASVMIGYLVWTKKYTLNEAYAYVKRLRPQIRPRHLNIMEKMEIERKM